MADGRREGGRDPLVLPPRAIPAELLEQAGSVARRRLAGARDREVVTVQAFVDLPGVELWRATESARLWRAYHWSYAFCTLVPGVNVVNQWRYRQRVHRSPPRTTMILEPEEVHVTTDLTGPADFHVLLVAPEVMREALGERAAGGAPHFREASLELPEISTRLHRLCGTLAREGDPLEREQRFRTFLQDLHARAGEAVETRHALACERAVRRAREFVEDNHAGPLSLDDVAAAAGVSKYHLERSFGLRVGVPIWEFVKQVRVRRAMAALRTGVRPADVATTVGFCDQAHMTRSMKDLFGFTPGELRRAHLPTRRT